MVTLMSHFFPGLAALWRGLVVFPFLALLGASSLLADTAYLTGPLTLSDSPRATAVPLATLSVASEVTVLVAENGFERVALEGWTRDGAERVLFAYPGKRILVARVDSDAIERMVRLDSVDDPDTAIRWNRMRIEGWIAAGNTLPGLDPIWDAAWELFSERCTACHERRVPSNYTANQWRSHIKVMGPRTGLPKDDQGLILTFLQHHASDTIDLQAADADRDNVQPGGDR